MTLSVETTDLIHEAFLLPATAIDYHLSQRLHAQYPDKALLEGGDCSFDLEEYARAGHCTLTVRLDPYPQLDVHWAGPKRGAVRTATNLWYDVQWQGEDIGVLILSWTAGTGVEHRHYILADTMAAAERFFCTVCQWNTELRDEVLVFEGGHWHKDPALFHAIKGATLDNLVLRGSLKQDIFDDLAGFFRAKETYGRYGVPWKRGILFVGPAGNGKTHAVKALVNALGRDCLYVKSFRSQAPDEYSIRNVFARARVSAPCILVLEDLDSLVTSQNRSFFLNELDGFAGNEGILTLATTNHPERLDPAILDRPSRFDRKYPFDLPLVEERATYIGMWNTTLQLELRLSDEGIRTIAEQTDGFSFAYLKELFISATMRWINVPQPGTMDEIMAGQVDVLRAQMASAITFQDVSQEDDVEMPEALLARMRMPRTFRSGWFSYQDFVSTDDGDVAYWEDESTE